MPSWSLPLLRVLARLLLGGVLIVAGILKIDGESSVLAIRGYQLPIPYGLVQVLGYALPVVEIILGVLIVVGLFTRVAGALGAGLMLVFVALIAQAWARGLSIDCGCFGGGGEVAPDQTRYLSEILRDLGLAVCGGWLAFSKDNAWSLDRLLFGTSESAVELDPPESLGDTDPSI